MHIIDLPSPNFDSRDGQAVDMLVLHYTGMKTAQEAKDRLCDPQAKVSAHYLVDEDGSVYRLVVEEMRAWHAGASYWRGNTNINQRSIGIEIVNPGHEFGYRAFPRAQMEAVATLCKDILSRHAIPARNVVGHSDVAPSRKEDPGELFDWQWLAGQGIGVLPVAKKWDKVKVWIYRCIKIRLYHIGVSRGLSGMVQRRQAHRTLHQEVAMQLQEWGYENGFSLSNDIDTWDHPIFKAFQRHYRSDFVSGRWDVECQTLLEALLKTI